jgi:hypothetical protein
VGVHWGNAGVWSRGGRPDASVDKASPPHVVLVFVEERRVAALDPPERPHTAKAVDVSTKCFNQTTSPSCRAYGEMVISHGEYNSPVVRTVAHLALAVGGGHGRLMVHVVPGCCQPPVRNHAQCRELRAQPAGRLDHAATTASASLAGESHENTKHHKALWNLSLCWRVNSANRFDSRLNGAASIRC